MKLNLISFSPETFRRRPEGDPTIRVTPDRLAITMLATQHLGLKVGDMVLVHQDQDRPHIWYLARSRKGFKLTANSAALNLHSRGLAQAILSAFGKTDAFSFFVAPKPVEVDGVAYWPLAEQLRHFEEVKGKAEKETPASDSEAPRKRRGRKPGTKLNAKEERPEGDAPKGRKKKEEEEFFDPDRHGW
jgi:hypothetical protein